MSTKKEEERNEKIIRGLMKLPPNRRCINCNSLGPQYVCTNFWTFVCITCSGIHREFTHRVKSVSMAKFTSQEVEALQRGGNQRAREQFLSDWDTQRMRLPDNSNPSKIREFIKNVYVDKKYVGGRSSDKPPRDTQTLKGEEDHRRASSYHSFSQSPPYDHQYEERRYGRQAGMLTRRPGSDRGQYEGKLSSFIYSPGRKVEQMYEDRFANEGSGSRMSDYSVSSTGDPFRFDALSPNFQVSGYSSPPLHPGDIVSEDMRPRKLSSSESNIKEDPNRIQRAHRSVSSGSFGSFDGNSVSLKSANSGGLIDSVLEPEQASGIQQAETSIVASSQMSLGAHGTNGDLFTQAVAQPQSPLVPSIDLFANFSQPSVVPPLEQKPAAVPSSGNEGWATFDLPHHMMSSEVNWEIPPMAPAGEVVPNRDTDLFSLMPNYSDWSSVQNPSSHGLSSLINDQLSVGFNGKDSSDSRSTQLWDAFDDLTGKPPQDLPGLLSQNSVPQEIPCKPPATIDSYIGFKAPEAPEVNFTDAFLGPAIYNKTSAAATLLGTHGPNFPPSAIPQMGSASQERKAANPFDLPFDSDTEPNNVFMDMSSLQAALPDQQSPSTFLGGLPDTWFSQNSLTSFIPSIPQGGLPYIGGQVPSTQLPNIPPQGPVASLGGNPFA